MAQSPVTQEQAAHAHRLVAEAGTVWRAAAAAGMADSTLNRHYTAAISRYGMPDVRRTKAGIMPRAPDAGAIVMPDLPEDVPEYGELKQRSIREFHRYKTAHDARRLVRLPVKMDGPIGLFATGDPHVDARGCDWNLIDAHTKLVRETKGLFATNVGDLANNWVGRLARLYAEQHVTPRETRVLIEGFFSDFGGKLLFVDCGNHDVWNGQDDLYRWLARAAASSVAWHGNRVALEFSTGAKVVINSRHDFKGSSQWNITHGPLKAAMMGDRDDIYTCGHLHAGGYQMLVHAGGEISHVCRLSSYKVLDPFKDEHGWRDQHLPAALFVINPQATAHAAKVTVFADPEAGADYLTYLRRRHANAALVPGGRDQVRRARSGGGRGGGVPADLGDAARRADADASARLAGGAARPARNRGERDLRR